MLFIDISLNLTNEKILKKKDTLCLKLKWSKFFQNHCGVAILSGIIRIFFCNPRTLSKNINVQLRATFFFYIMLAKIPSSMICLPTWRYLESLDCFQTAWKTSGQSWEFLESLESFTGVWMFPASLDSVQTVYIFTDNRKFLRKLGKFADSLKFSRTI